MKKQILCLLSACIVFSQFQGFTSVLAEEMDTIKIADTTGPGLPETQEKTYSKDAVQEEPSKEKAVIKKEPTLYPRAQMYREEQEEITQRTSTSKTYDLGDGKYVTRQFFEPIHKEKNGELVDIDHMIIPSLQRTLDGETIYKNKDGIYQFTYQNDRIQLKNEASKIMEIHYPDAYMKDMVNKENAMYFTGIYEDDVDLQITLDSHYLFQSYVLNSRSERTSFYYDLYTEEEVRIENENICIGGEERCAFTILRPVLKDRDTKEDTTSTYSLEKREDHYRVTLTISPSLDRQDLVYPLELTSTKVAATTTDIDGVYVRSKEPYVTSAYDQLFVGNDVYNYSGQRFGVARTFMNISFSLPTDQTITDASLHLYKKQIPGYPEWNEVSVKTAPDKYALKTINWANQPSPASTLSTNAFSIDGGYKSLDITEYIRNVYTGDTKERTLILQSTNEGTTSQGANVFFSAMSKDANLRPYIEITHQDAYDVRPDLPIDNFDREMRVFTRNPDGFQALSFDGIAKPNSTIHFQLQEKQADGSYVFLKDYSANPGLYFTEPIFKKQPIAGTQDYAAGNVNYTTDYIYAADFPYLDRFYNFKTIVKKDGAQSSGVSLSDGFTLYKVKTGDTLRSIAAYYGIEVDTIIQDNRLAKTIVKEGDILFLRFLTNNPKLSPDAYRPPVKVTRYDAEYKAMGPNCIGCRDLDPVNMANGNYHHSSKDITVKDYEELSLVRTFNSTAERASSLFGNGWSTNLEQYLSRTKEGDILYFRGDGRIAKIKDMKAEPDEKLTISQVGGNIEIYDKQSEETYIFDEYDTLLQIRNKQGNTSHIHYDTYGMITSIDMGTKRITFTYNAQHLVNQITLPNGFSVQYVYDKDRHLTTYRDAAGNTETYAYDEKGQLTSVTDKAGNQLGRNTYDREGRVLEQIDAADQASQITYQGNTATITYPGNTTKSYTQEDGNITKITDENGHSRSFTYDENDNIISETNALQEVTTYRYDERNNLIEKKNSDGTKESYRFDNFDNLLEKKNVDGTSETFQYDSSGNRTLHVKENATSITYTYNAQNQVIKKIDDMITEYTYDGPHLIQEARSDGLIKYYRYDSVGNLIGESDNQGHFTEYTYNAQNLIIQKKDAQGIEQYGYDGNGNVTDFIDKNGVLTKTTYDAMGRPITITKGTLTKTMSYDASGNKLSETDEQGITTTYTYDGAGNILTETKNGMTTTYAYDARDRLVQTTYPSGTTETKTYRYDLLVSETDQRGLTTTYAYDAQNRLIKTTHPNGTVETKTYDGSLLREEVDQKGIRKIYTYDHRGNVTKLEEVIGQDIITTENTYDEKGRLATSTKEGITTTYTYDLFDNPLTIQEGDRITTNTYDLFNQMLTTTDPLGNTTAYSYDRMGNQTSITFPNQATTTKTYNALNQLIQETNELQETTTYTYNDRGQMITSTDTNGIITTYRYDAYGNVKETLIDGKTIAKDTYDGLGRKIEEVTLADTKRYAYDIYGQVVKESNETTGLIIRTTYDAYGNPTLIEDNGNQKTIHEYDEKQRLIKTIDSYGRVSTKTYDAYDRVQSETSPEGLTTAYTYDKLGQVLTQTDAHGITTRFTYDNYQNKVREETPLVTYLYTYDALHRELSKTEETTGAATTRTYDAMGNILSERDALGNTTTYTYDLKNRKITETKPNGAITETTYDSDDRVIQQTNPDGSTIKTRYDALGLKTQEEDERGFVTTYTYNAQGQVIEILDKLGGKTKLRYDAQGRPRETILDNGTIYTQEYDLYGNVIKEIDPNGNIITTRYDSLGNILTKQEPYKTTTHTYDERGNLLTTKENERILVTNTYDHRNQLIKTKDALDQVSTYTYDAYGRKQTSNEKGFKTEYTYDAHGNIIQEIQNEERVFTYTYDVLNRELEQKQGERILRSQRYDENGNIIEQSEKGITIQRKYDMMDRVIEELERSLTTEGFLTTKTNVYDLSGNLIEERNGTGDTLTYTYDAHGNITSKTDGNGNVTKYAYNTLNLMTKLETPQGRVVHYDHDGNGNITAQYFHEQKTSYTYDQANRLIEESDRTGTEKTSYDAYGNVIAFQQKNGNIIHSEYDELNRLIKQNERSFTYNAQNKQILAENEEGTLKNEYDLYGNLLMSTDPNGKKVTYTYDEFDQKTSITYPSGEVVTYTYNDKHQVEDVRRKGRILAQYAYDVRGNVAKLTQDNVITTYAYDNANRVIRYLTSKDQKVIRDHRYAFDSNGNVIKEIVDGNENSFTYNENDELKSSIKHIDGEIVETTYGFDLYGNRTEKSSNGTYSIFQYNDKNQLKSIQTEEGISYLHYDDNGNLSAAYYADGFKESYTYDAYNQLITIKNNEDKILSYRYDATGERIGEHVKDEKTYQTKSYYTTEEKLDLSDLRDRLTEEDTEEIFNSLKKQANIKEENGGCITTTTHYKLYDYKKDDEEKIYVVDRSQEFSQILMENEDTTIYGISRLETNQTKYITGLNDSITMTITANKETKITYDDYGYSKAIKEGFGYNGEKQDSTGLIYLRARYYNPRLGRFIQIDPYKGEENNLASKNRYTYVYNNPYKYVDESGNRPKLPSINTGKAGQGVSDIVSKTNPLLTVVKNIANTVTDIVKSVGNIVANATKPTYDTPDQLYNKNPNMDIDDYYMYKLYYNTQIEPCPISEAIGGFIKSGVDIVSGAISGTINYAKDLITNPVDTFVKTYHGITNAIVSGWEYVTSEKFWIQLGMGVGTAALAVMAVAATPFTLSTGAIGAIGFMTFTSTGELYDYEITYDHNTEEFVKGKGYANIHQYLGGFAFKNMLAGYSGYQIGNSIGSAIGGSKGYKYSKSVIEKADNLYHDFPISLDDFILENPTVYRTDGRIEYLAHGSINGKDGIYHITTKGDTIIHRTFIPTSDWNRFSSVNDLPSLDTIPVLR